MELIDTKQRFIELRAKGWSFDKIAKEPNTNRVHGSLFAQHVFGTLSFSGEKETRQMKMSLFDKDGHELWNKTILKSELE